MNLIVRVKRRRDQEPSDSLWIMDDAEAPSKKKLSTRKITESLGALSTSANQTEHHFLESKREKERIIHSRT
jgi:hypothetical protein